MMAVETGDWEVARGKIADAKDTLAAAGMIDSTLAALPELVTALEASRKVQKLSDMVYDICKCVRFGRSVGRCVYAAQERSNHTVAEHACSKM